MFNGITNELSLLAKLKINLLLIVLALDVRHVDGDEYISLAALEAQKGHDNGSEVGGRGLVV